MGELGEEPAERHEHWRLRVSDADRHTVAEVLRDAAGEGRLGLDELDERLEATYAAKTYADMVPLVADLPADPRLVAIVNNTAPVERRRPTSLLRPVEKSVAMLGDCKRTGEWLLSPEHQATALVGDVVLDLREAAFQDRQTIIKATAVIGDVKVYVDEFTRVEIDGTRVLGSFKQRRDKATPELGPDSPTVIVQGVAILGDVRVQRR